MGTRAVDNAYPPKLLNAIDQTLDCLVPAWELMVTQVPDVLERIGTNPISVADGLHIGLQMTWVITHHYLCLPGASPLRISAYEAAARGRWALTLQNFSPSSTITEDDFVSGRSQTETVSQVRHVLGLLVEAQLQHGGPPYAGAVARALVHLAETACLADGLCASEHLGHVNALRLGLIEVLQFGGCAFEDEAPTTHPVWHPAMSRTLEQEEHPLALPVTQFLEALTTAMNAQARDEDEGASAPALVLGSCFELIGTANLDAETLAAASVFAGERFSPDRAVVWSARQVRQLALGSCHHGTDLLLDVMTQIARAEEQRPKDMRGMTLQLTTSASACLAALVASISATSRTHTLLDHIEVRKAYIVSEFQRQSAPSSVTADVQARLRALPSFDQIARSQNIPQRQDAVIDVYLLVRQSISRWYEISTTDLDDEGRGLLSQRLTFGLFAPLLEVLNDDLDSWLFQRVTHGNGKGELDYFDAGWLRQEAENLLVNLICMGVVTASGQGEDLDAALTSALQILSLLATGIDAVIDHGEALGADRQAMLAAADAAGLGQVSDRVFQEIVEVIRRENTDV